VDLKVNRFDVTYDPGRLAVSELLDAIRKLEYEPDVVATRPEASSRGVTKVDVSSLPAELGKLFAAARDANKPVLLQFSGPG